MRITLLSWLSFIFCYCIYHSVHISFASAKCLEDQQSLLLQLKNNLTFMFPESSSKLKLWNQSIACCNWRGVTCDNEGHVTGLDLSGESISGGFDDSSSLFSLQHLKKLNLADNYFNSLIPSGFSKLEKLTYLNLSDNYFVGQIPMEISQLTRLVALDVSYADTSGEIPSSIGNLKQLEYLDLSRNSLGGQIPVQLASLSFLSYLNLSFNHLLGEIPTGTQLQLFPASSFEGNDGLYGPPLTGKPDDKKEGLLPQPTCRRLACSIDWNFVSVELGFVFGFGIVIGPLLFWKQWRVRYRKLVDKILCWIFPKLYLEYATHRGQTYTILRWWWH